MLENWKNRNICSGINDAAKSIYEDNKAKGFWGKDREIGTILMLCVSELSEALEADRKGRKANLDKLDLELTRFSPDIDALESHIKTTFEKHVKDTFEDELADTIIRILDLCGSRGIDIERHINLKLTYNRSRERLHGKTY